LAAQAAGKEVCRDGWQQPMEVADRAFDIGEPDVEGVAHLNHGEPSSG